MRAQVVIPCERPMAALALKRGTVVMLSDHVRGQLILAVISFMAVFTSEAELLEVLLAEVETEAGV
jgi:hypothetical protein